MVGGYPDVADVPWLGEAHGVTAVLSLQDDADLAAKRLDRSLLERAYAAAGIAFARMPVPEDGEERLARVLPDAVTHLDALHREGHVAYLHCNAGMNRAPTVAIAYLHVHQGLALSEATRVVKSRRPCLPFQGVLRRVYARTPLPPPKA